MTQLALRTDYRRLPVRWIILSASLVVAAGCTEKSRNPLSPNIAGPIEGVSISAPALMSPADGALIKVDEQPVWVMFTNGVSNGERPVLYNVRVAADADFVEVLHEATEIPADPSGQTSYEVPAGLDPEQMYYWRAQADDGVNASDHSPVGRFEVYTPVGIEAPQIQVPSPGSGGGSPASTLVINVPVVNGPAEDARYEVQVAKDQGFANIVLTLSGSINGNSVTIDVASLFSSTSQATAAALSAQSVSSLAAGGLKGNTNYHCGHA